MDKNIDINAFLIEKPENILKNRELVYSIHEIHEVTNQFDLAKSRAPFYPTLLNLLRATALFLGKTDPYSDIRRATSTKENTQQTFKDMQEALIAARTLQDNLSGGDQEIFNLVLHYCESCLKRHTQTFNADDQLQETWHASDLKKILS